MLFGILTLVAALTISGVAIYYSVAGLAAIFAAAVVPIVIMGTTLEVSKLVTVVWLHRYWRQAAWWLKTYLVTAVVVLMFITSLGIFGFLSKAHVEQTSQSIANQSRVERIDEEIARQQARISRADAAIVNVQEQGTGGDRNIQQQIDREQERIDRIYARAEPEIENYRAEIRSVEQRYIDQINQIDRNLSALDEHLDSGRIRQAQAIIGVQVDGALGPNTAAAIREYRESKQEERRQLREELSNISESPVVRQAREQIERIRTSTEQQVAESNQLITRLRSQLGATTGVNIDAIIEEESQKITQATQEIDRLTEEKFALESEFRALEAEVGPIKYIAEFIYGDTDRQLLEDAVRWVIIIIIFVFDPLAVLLLIASQYTFRWHGMDLFEFNGPEEPPEQTPPPAPKPEPALSAEEVARPYAESTVEPVVEKKDIESQEESPEDRQAILDAQEDCVHWSEAKKTWKDQNPHLTLKEQKELFLKGEIDKLPWEDYLTDESEADQKKRYYMMKENNHQVKKPKN